MYVSRRNDGGVKPPISHRMGERSVLKYVQLTWRDDPAMYEGTSRRQPGVVWAMIGYKHNTNPT